MNAARQESRNTKNPLEWAVFSLSSVLVAGVLGFLLWSSISLGESPSSFVLKSGTIRYANESTIIPIHITNSGSATAAEVNVSVIASYPAGDRESTLTLDFVPRGGSRDGYAIFPGTEKPSAVSARVIGYIEP